VRSQKFRVAPGDFLAEFDLFRENSEFGEKDGRLDRIEPPVDSDANIVVFVIPFSVHPDRIHDFRGSIIVGKTHTSITITSQGLGGEKRGAGDVPKRASPLSLVFSPKRLGRVFNDPKAVFLGYRLKGTIICGQAEEIYGDDPFWF